MERSFKQDTFVIIGLGWLGAAFAKTMLEKKHLVVGTTRSVGKDNTLQKKGLFAWRFSLGETLPREVSSAVQGASVLISISPSTQGLSPLAFYTALESFVQSLNPLKPRNILFTSSTSVYPAGRGQVGEEQAVGSVSQKSGINQFEVEKRVQQASAAPVSIVRLGGLFGPERHPGGFFGSSPIIRSHDPVNVVHRDDAIGVLERLSQESNSWVVNACAPIHPSKQEFYTQAAKKLGLPPPRTAPPWKSVLPKIVDSSRLVNSLNYSFVHPDPIVAIDYC